MKRLGQGDLDRLVAELYETALQERLWPEWFGRAASAFGGNSGLSVVQSPQTGAVDVLGIQGLSPQAIGLYAEYYHSRDLWAARSAARLMQATLSADLCSDAEFANSEIYTDFSKPHGGDAFYVVGAVLPVERDVAVIGFQRTRAQGPYERAHARALDRLLPHLQRALLVRARLTAAEERLASLEATLESLRHGVLLSTRDGTVLHANAAAQAVLRQRDGLGLAQGGQLTASRGADTARLRSLIAGCSLPGGGGALRLERPSGARPLELLAVPLGAAGQAGVPGKATALVFLHDPETETAALPGLLAGLYCLTPAESRLAADLLGHLGLEEIAARRGVGRETLRSQLKELFRKTGTTRQSELIGRLASGVAGAVRRDR